MLKQVVLISPIVFVMGCSGPAMHLGISQQVWQSMPPAQRQQVLTNAQKIAAQQQETVTAYDGPVISIYLLKGSAMMPPFKKHYLFVTQQFYMHPGECHTAILQSINTNGSTTLQLCYNGLQLALDPSRYALDEANGSLFLDYNPVWKHGFTYDNVTTTGYTRLKNAEISIKALRN